jgi:CRISPR-associated protein Csb2
VTAIGICYLTGYAAATDLAADAPEWPPHPGRVFMALAAAHFQTRGGVEERAALLWLESLPPPSMYASDAQPRSKVESYVPVKDEYGRQKQLRAFRKKRPDCNRVVLRWNVDPPDSIAAPLRALCEKVTRIGYSASLTQVWLACAEPPELPASNWIPEEGLDSSRRMRIPTSWTLARLEHSYNKTALDEYEALQEALASAVKSARAKIRNKIRERFPVGAPQPERPNVSVWHGYRMVSPGLESSPTVQGPFDPGFLVFAVREGCILGLESTQQLTGALRNAAMKVAGDNGPEWLTGHTPERRPSEQPHAAFFPLPFVGRKYADGHVMGLGIALPRWLSQTTAGRVELRERLGPLLFNVDGSDRKVKLWSDAGKWEWELEREVQESVPYSLQRRNWIGPSRDWASVTPVVLHHHPKRRGGHAEQILADALVTAQYPGVERIRLSPVSVFEGARTVSEMPPYTQGGENLCRYQVHAVVRFRESVEGPILAGRGRYRGYGLFKPYSEAPG